MDQVILLKENIKNFFVDLTAAYDLSGTVALPANFLRLLRDKHMIRMIIKLIGNESFTLTSGDSKQSRLRRLKNSVPQESDLALYLFDLFIFTFTSSLHNFQKV